MKIFYEYEKIALASLKSCQNFCSYNNISYIQLSEAIDTNDNEESGHDFISSNFLTVVKL